MNYKTNSIPELSISKNQLLSIVTEADIYRKYIGFSYNDGKVFRSPFNEDRTPSFKFFFRDGSWLWKDFSSGKGGDCIKLVSELCNCSYNKAINIIWIEMNLYKSHKFIKNNYSFKEPKIPKYKKDSKSESSCIIEVVVDEWDKIYEDYWLQYGLSVSDIDNNITNIKPCKEVWLTKGNNSFIVYNKLVDRDICFRYKIGNKYKIYRPLAKNKKDKWLSNTGNNDVQNIENLFKFGNELLIITKSYKDALCLNKLGYNAIAFSTEASRGIGKIINWLKTKFKYVILFYDNDDAGKTNSLFLSQEYLLNQIFIPDSIDKKDISDYIKKYSLYEADILLKELLKQINIILYV